ncbi:ABC transporter permease [Enterococcus italicus]|uniref:ABC transporter permease n=1 Tax=Enterococcus italicus TaxID=246144 RepID=UPI0020741F9D|nr:ABC transporter permease [Enterococcus italicus]
MQIFERKNRILLKELVKTDFKMRYQGSIIGYVWSVLKPLMLFAVMYVVFVRFLKFGADVPHFSVALLLGTVLWGFFNETTSLSMSSIVGRSDLIRKLSFPTNIIVISISLNALINLIISLVIVCIFAVINGVSISKFAFLSPLLILELYIFSLGISFMLATIYVRFRDIGPIWEVILQIVMYMTPMIYPVSLVINVSPTIAKILMLNPLAQIMQDLRFLLISDQNITIWMLINNKILVLIPYLLSILTLIIGYYIFNKHSKKFAEMV